MQQIWGLVQKGYSSQENVQSYFYYHLILLTMSHVLTQKQEVMVPIFLQILQCIW